MRASLRLKGFVSFRAHRAIKGGAGAVSLIGIHRARAQAAAAAAVVLESESNC